MRLFIWSDEVSKARLVRDAARPGGHRVHVALALIGLYLKT